MRPATPTPNRAAQSPERQRRATPNRARQEAGITPPALNPRPGSSTKLQHQTLVIAGKRRGFTLAEIRQAVGGSITRLSAAECSNWITHYSGKGLANPPGEKPSVYAGKRAGGATRIITADQIDQIIRLGLDYFGFRGRFAIWLRKTFQEIPVIEALDRDDLDYMIRALSTAQRAAEVIVVLKQMNARKTPKEKPNGLVDRRHG